MLIQWVLYPVASATIKTRDQQSMRLIGERCITHIYCTESRRPNYHSRLSSADCQQGKIPGCAPPTTTAGNHHSRVPLSGVFGLSMNYERFKRGKEQRACEALENFREVFLSLRNDTSKIIMVRDRSWTVSARSFLRCFSAGNSYCIIIHSFDSDALLVSQLRRRRYAGVLGYFDSIVPGLHVGTEMRWEKESNIT